MNTRPVDIVSFQAYFAQIGLQDAVNLVEVCSLGVDHHVSDPLYVSPVGAVPGENEEHKFPASSE